MNTESRRDLRLLEVLESDASITQRRLATRLGIALGLTNLYLKRLIRKGYVKCVTVSPNRLRYIVTPRGAARRVRLTYEFMRYSLDFYRDARRNLRQTLGTAVTARQRIAIFGTGDAAELVYLLLRELNFEPVAIFSAEPQSPFLGLSVRPISEQAQVAYDVLIVATLERPGAALKRVRNAGVPVEKILPLQPVVPN